jgi:hypothetical protein
MTRLNTLPKQSKYKNTKVEIDGIKFDSKKEAQRWRELKLLEQAGKISNLKRQIPYVLQEKYRRKDGKTVQAIKYVVDFEYTEEGKTVVEDVKGYDKKKGTFIITKDARLKHKMFEFRYRDVELRLI